MPNIIMCDPKGGALKTDTLISDTSHYTINTIFRNGNIPLLYQDCIIIWNIKGDALQTSGTVTVKMGMTVVQNGIIVANGSVAKQASSKTEPDSAVPGTSGWSNGTFIQIENGKISATNATSAYVGIGNTVDVIQIPYNIGWNV